MNAPDTHALPAMFPLDQVLASPTNPRKHFDADGIAELAESIKQHGVLQPILLRRWTHFPPRGMTIGDCCGCYEIVVGERRWRASKAAGLTEIPAYVRELDDKAVLEIQVIENLQRSDLHEIEEADGYRQMIDKHGYTAESLAAKIGQSKAYVYGRLKLCALIAAGRDACFDGSLSASTALLIARMPETLQAKALNEVTGEWDGPMSFRRAARLIQTRYMLRLGDASFDRGDATLCPKAGSCQDCQKRTGAQPELFSDVDSADVCTDPDCFAAKKAAHGERLKAQARERGQKVIDGTAAKKLKPNAYSDIAGDYLALDKKCYDDPKTRTYRQLLGKNAPPPEILVDPHDKSHVIEVLPRATVAEHLAAKGIDIAKRPSSGKSDEEKAAEKKRKIETDYRGRLFGAIRSTLTLKNEHATRTYTDADWRLVASRFWQTLGHDERKKIATLWYGPGEGKQDEHQLTHDFGERIPTLPASNLQRLLIEMAVVGNTFVSAYSSRDPDALIAAAENLDIDHAAIKKAAQAEARAKEKAKAKPAAKGAAKPAKVDGKAATAEAPAAASKAPAAKKKAAKNDGIRIGERVLIKHDAVWENGGKVVGAGKTGTVNSWIHGFYTVLLNDGTKVMNLAANQIEPVLAHPVQDDDLGITATTASDLNSDAPTQLAPEPAWPFPTKTAATA